MASTSTPQQGNLPTEVIPQIGSLDSTQVAQILRNLPGLLNKVSCHSTPEPFHILFRWPVRFVSWSYGRNRRWNGIPIIRASCDHFWNMHPL